ncbi:MAG: RNA-binding transcriptional accessory protein [Fibrobacterota bacterium]|nr:RNA-binding transcriptional accessory protein [Fibrobacterota bacterium]
MSFVELIASETKLRAEQVRNTLALFDQGSTVPFITRYRKEATGSLDENQLRLIEERYLYYKELSDRKETILKSIETQGKLTPDLKAKIEKTISKTELEDLYLPYKPKRRTRAMAAKEAGLEPLARILEAQEAPTAGQTPEQLAQAYVNAELNVADATAALQGALDILAEEISEDAGVRGQIREMALKTGLYTAKVRKEHEGKRTKFEMYYDFSEKVSALPSHRILAMRRGEKEEVLRTELVLEDEKCISVLAAKAIKPSSPYKVELEKMVKDAYERLLKPSIETEVRMTLKERADGEAYLVFQKNLRDVLLAPPGGSKVVMGVDPGFRTGVKLAVIDGTGKLLEYRTIHPMPPQNQVEASETIMLAMIESFKVEIIAIGNGTASRETDEFIGNAFKKLEKPPIKVVVSEAGASVYSTSPLAGKEFPDLDATIRSAVSIARRIQDPLAELVKIDPKSIGVGQYQHDVNQNELKRKLEQVVESCVNSVGVDVNSASEALLGYVAGINKSLAKNIVEHRNANGAFGGRSGLVKVSLFGPKAFEQAAGFLRVNGSDNLLDASAVHPERYELVKKIVEEIGTQVKDIIGNSEVISKIDLNKYVSEDVGLPTLLDIASELEKPSRDPRAEFVYARFDSKVQGLKDLTQGMWLEGIVTNVTNFGAFIDIGVHQDGLVHISELADKFIDDAKKLVAAGQIVQVRVLDVDVEQKRISLSMKKESAEKPAGNLGGRREGGGQRGQGQGQGRGPGQGERQGQGQGQGGFQGQGQGRGGQGQNQNQNQRTPKKPTATVAELKDKFATDDKKKQNNIKLAFSLKALMRSGR